MCDYSLCGLPTRLAVEGEELVVHRFRTGSVGLASPADLYRSEPPLTRAPRKRLWDDAKSILFGDGPAAPPTAAVCLPPGARLILKDIPRDLQRQWNIGEKENVVFLQIDGDAWNYRDAVRFRNGIDVLLQGLEEGMRVQVLSLGNASADNEKDLFIENEPAYVGSKSK